MNIISIFKKFPTQESCIEYLEKIKWNNEPECPYCHQKHSTLIQDKKYHIKRYHCNKCNTTFSVLINTIFQDTKLELQKWFLAISIIMNAKKGISSRQLARDLEVNLKTAWYMQMRIRKAMKQDENQLLKGIVEMDETYIGGKPRGKGEHKRGRGTNKLAIIGMVERKGIVKAELQDKKKLKCKDLKKLVYNNIDKRLSTLITDDYRGYMNMNEIINHKTINHSIKEYVKIDNTGFKLHTNTIEGFWSLLKRCIVGQYHSLSGKYLNKYIDEFCFKYNNRKNKSIFDLLLIKALGI